MNNQRGVALVIVLGVIVTVTALAIEFMYNTKVNYNLALNLRDQIQAEYLAKSALNFSVLMLKIQKQLDQKLGTSGAGSMVMSLPIDTRIWRGLGLESQEEEPPKDFRN